MEDIVASKVAEILEQWGLMLVDPAEKDLSIFEVDEPFYRASIHFKGAVNGAYQVICQRPFARVLVANLLGEEPEEATVEAEGDALKEMVNVMSGNLLTSTYGVDTTFDLMPPEVSEISPGEAEEVLRGKAFAYSADDNPVVVAFTLDVTR